MDFGGADGAIGSDVEREDNGAFPTVAAGFGGIGLNQAGEVGDELGGVEAGGGAGGLAGRALPLRGRLGRREGDFGEGIIAQGALKRGGHFGDEEA